MGLLDRYKRHAVIVRPNPGLPDDIEELAAIEYARWKGIQGNLDRSGEIQAAGRSIYFQETIPPWQTADFSAVTLATTMKQLYTTSEYARTYQNDWWVGKLFHVRAFGKITTAATPGNLTVQLGYGTSDGTTGALATSAALTLIASQTNASWRFEGRVRCRGTGATGSLLGTGILEIAPGVVAAGQALVPASAPAAVSSLDLTTTSGIHLQFARSGSTAETAAIVDMDFAAEN